MLYTRQPVGPYIRYAQQVGGGQGEIAIDTKLPNLQSNVAQSRAGSATLSINVRNNLRIIRPD